MILLTSSYYTVPRGMERGLTGRWIGCGERVALGARPVLELVPSLREGFTIEPRSKFRRERTSYSGITSHA
ncbi:hypothetical protein M407DRAFT_119946 [Tulasnella calospora MUT 4182]|uniref:Uncharacterized protein n=1 Tax=Tulasnella calospora MUT 4182 TaxID=1051891 RepID=A0A0C3LLF3_9AGAM|nr:hypothetical protein M407DRAFT_119946 [Tulasnella calospora MUT 4182]